MSKHTISAEGATRDEHHERAHADDVAELLGTLVVSAKSLVRPRHVSNEVHPRGHDDQSLLLFDILALIVGHVLENDQ